MKFRRQPAQEISVNMTSLIDVVFLLLIFFMVTTTFTQESRLQIDLPEAAVAGAPPESREIIIEINAAGKYVVSGTALAGNGIEAIKSALEAASAGDSKRPLVISADARTPHEAVVNAMEAAGTLGFSKLSIATREASSD